MKTENKQKNLAADPAPAAHAAPPAPEDTFAQLMDCVDKIDNGSSYVDSALSLLNCAQDRIESENEGLSHAEKNSLVGLYLQNWLDTYALLNAMRETLQTALEKISAGTSAALDVIHAAEAES